MKTWRKWTEEENQAFFSLLRNKNLISAIREHSRNTGRTVQSILNHFYLKRRRNEIPSDILNSILNLKDKWEESETKALLKLIKEHPNNFEEAYRIHAENTGRTAGAVRYYFHTIRKNPDAPVCMMSIGERKRVSANRKNIYPGTGGTVEPIRKSKWRRILEIIFK